jgi:hypothetical protein
MYWVCDTTKQFYKQYYQLCFSNTHIRDRYSLSDSVWYLIVANGPDLVQINIVLPLCMQMNFS